MNEQTMAIINSMIPFILIIAVFYFMLIRPQKKREKETQNMRNSIDVGHEIVTGGGIIGTVVSVRDDHLVIETGSDRSKLRITRWAVAEDRTALEEASNKK
ncbi:MAG: preprotein translocase subunit YajC [Anaerotruncus sp.]|nr:preprotein translocase subunit YajC [Anaerotruncus sp.]